jgi:hypothetical protein
MPEQRVAVQRATRVLHLSSNFFKIVQLQASSFKAHSFMGRWSQYDEV